MYRISVPTEKEIYEISELAKEFFDASSFAFFGEDSADYPKEQTWDLHIKNQGDRNAHKRQLYEFLCSESGRMQDWGILTGVRPGKLFNEQVKRHGMQNALNVMKNTYLLSDDKIRLLRRTHDTQTDSVNDPQKDSVGIYIGIPFCPTRCSYCSFTSNKITKKGASAYMNALLHEISAVSEMIRERSLFAESVYIGGGTPTSLDDEDFEELLCAARDAFVSDRTAEFTVEAGRPDTITDTKLSLIKKYGADRISINPQSMKQHTLDLIGRSHTPQQITEAFECARRFGIPVINADVIAGLPEEDANDFDDTLKKILALHPENITVHTLAVKRASRLIEQNPCYNYTNADSVKEMLARASSSLDKNGYEPYYLYRQKHMTGNFENVGYCLRGTANRYNIRIMEENQTILALGAGSVSKIYFPDENRLERAANVSNYEIYIDRTDEMINRKAVTLDGKHS